jgi:hypothetical protein
MARKKKPHAKLIESVQRVVSGKTGQAGVTPATRAKLLRAAKDLADGLLEAELERAAAYENFMARLHKGAAVRVKQYEQTPMKPIHWKNASDGSGKKVFKLLYPEKRENPYAGMYGRRQQVTWRAVCDANRKTVEIPEGSIGYIFNDESPFAGKPNSKMKRVRMCGWDGWLHVDNIELYEHDKEHDGE